MPEKRRAGKIFLFGTRLSADVFLVRVPSCEKQGACSARNGPQNSCRSCNFCRIFTSLLMRPELDYMWRKKMMTTNFTKQPPLLEDLRSHTSEQVAELRLLLTSGAPSRPDPRRPGFFELDGAENVFYVFKYPSGTKVLLVGVWEREHDRVAELAVCSCGSAA